MSSPEDLTKFTEPQHVVFGMGEGLMALGATIHTPSVIATWRAEVYKAAVADLIPDDADEQQLNQIHMGCHWAANRSSRYKPYQTSTSRDYRDTGSELSAEESTVLGLLGGDTFMQIHTMAPPSELIDYMLTGGTHPRVKPRLSEITVAVIKGQISWEERFATAGVPLPEQYVDMITAQEDRYSERERKEYLSPPAKLAQALGSLLKKMIS